MSNSDSKIEEFKKLIREHGIAVATSVAEANGIVYSENFTESHISDPIFSNPHLISRKNFVNTRLFNPEYSNSVQEGMTIKELDKEQITISTNTVSYIEYIDMSIESGTGINIERMKPNVTIQSTQ